MIENHLRRRFMRLELCADLLELRRLCVEARSKLFNLLLLFPHFAMLFEELVEQHRVHRVVAPTAMLAMPTLLLLSAPAPTAVLKPKMVFASAPEPMAVFSPMVVPFPRAPAPMAVLSLAPALIASAPLPTAVLLEPVSLS